MKKCFSCSGCAYKSAKKVNLIAHINAVHDGTEFSCELEACASKFTQKVHLQNHIRTDHEGQRRFRCTHCEYKAADQISLRRHIQSLHEGIRYQCTFCTSKFTQKSKVKSHIESVHEGKKFECFVTPGLHKRAKSSHTFSQLMKGRDFLVRFALMKQRKKVVLTCILKQFISSLKNFHAHFVAQNIRPMEI